MFIACSETTTRSTNAHSPHDESLRAATLSSGAWAANSG
jgi:hypothetical protein